MNIRLTTKEEQVMNYFWQHGDMFVRQLQLLYPDPKPHFNTLSTVVRGLEEKGLISHRSYGNSYQYYAVITSDQFKERRLKDIIDSYYDKSILSAVSALVENESISVDELKELIALVEKSE